MGIQHAVRLGAPPVASCGADLKDWLIFPHLSFIPGSSASCQRCAQLVSARPATVADAAQHIDLTALACVFHEGVPSSVCRCTEVPVLSGKLGLARVQDPFTGRHSVGEE